MVAASLIAKHRTPDAGVLELVGLVRESLRTSLNQLQPTLSEEGITMGQFWALKTVSSLEAASLSTVARYLDVSPPTLCANIDQLESAGLVRRHRSERDHRSVELSLTARGRRVEARVWSHLARVMSERSHGVDAADMAATLRVFRVLAGDPNPPAGLARGLP
jgi:MarR family transcriptional regulator, organic hydroperoxide resistance regulator